MSIQIYHSFWSEAHSGIPKNFSLMTELSAKLALKNYGNIHLITDTPTLNLVKDVVEWTSISTSLDYLDASYKRTWSLGKIHAFKEICQKRQPFFHIDYDVFLWKKLPLFIEESEIACQSMEKILGAYDIEVFYKNCPNKHLCYEDQNFIDQAPNMGLFGGNNLDFISFFIEESLKLVYDEQNSFYWKEFLHRKDKSWMQAVMAEQYYLNVCAQRKNKKIVTLFNFDDFDETTALKYGYTHLQGLKEKFDARGESFWRKKISDLR